jgi:hypothetical protein
MCMVVLYAWAWLFMAATSQQACTTRNTKESFEFSITPHNLEQAVEGKCIVLFHSGFCMLACACFEFCILACACGLWVLHSGFCMGAGEGMGMLSCPPVAGEKGR